MRNIKTVLAAIVLICLLINSCKEVGPIVPWGSSILSDTTYQETPPAAQNRNVLVELFTGVQCINCPTGDALVTGFVTTPLPSGAQVVGVALHSSFQDDSIPGATSQSLTSNGANNLLAYFGGLVAKPCAAVDRVYHSNVASILDYNKGNWSGYISTEVTNPLAQVNLSIPAITFNQTSGQLTLAVKTEYVQSQTDSNKLSIFLTEDSIITGQYLPSGATDTNYVQNYVFRDAVSNIEGDPINANLIAGTVNVKTYSYTITNHLWKPNHMHVVVFVTNNNNNINPPNISVLQCMIVPL